MPTVAGSEAVTRIKYPAPVAVAAGIVMFIDPVLAVELSVPILTGAAKLPDAFDNSAV